MCNFRKSFVFTLGSKCVRTHVIIKNYFEHLRVSHLIFCFQFLFFLQMIKVSFFFKFCFFFLDCLSQTCEYRLYLIATWKIKNYPLIKRLCFYFLFFFSMRIFDIQKKKKVKEETNLFFLNKNKISIWTSVTAAAVHDHHYNYWK